MKNGTYILLVTLCALCFQNKAQVYFNNRYDTFGSCDGASMIDTFNNKYLTGSFTCSSISFYALNLKLYNKNDGIVSANKTYNWSGNNFANANGIKKNNKYLLSGTRFYHNDTSLVFQWIFNKNLDSIKYTEYGYLNKGNVINHIVYDNDKHYYMVGQVYDNVYNSDVLLIKTDTAGNEIWKKKIGIAGIDETGMSIETLQGDLIIAGYKTPHNANTFSGFVTRLDTAGNTIWNRPINTNYFGGGKAKKLKDGNILIYSQYKKYTSGSDDYGLLQVEKITPNNATLWSKQIGPIGINIGPSSAIENKHGNIVIDGQVGIPTNIVNGIVYEIAQNGDSIFSREYAIMPGSQNYFRDMIQTDDGGYCFAGFASPIFANGGTGTEDIWLLKVDSNFCESSASCGYGVGLAPLSFGEGLGVRLYPNPVNESLTLAWVEGEGIEPNTMVTIINSLGEIVLSPLSLGEGLGVRTINTSHLPSGLYYLSIKTKDKTMTRKIMIQK